MPGTLYVVATPIGNLEDVTLRALRVLRQVRVIAAEDTRRTARLLQHYSISTPTTSLHEHNERQKTPALIERLKTGDSVALVSDAGTPTLSDPGAHLVSAAHAAGIRVEPVPGPVAAVAALSAAGFEPGEVIFVGFPPSRSLDRKKWLARLASEERVVILYEAPHRIEATLREMLEEWGDRTIAVGRELTKSHEELVVQPISAYLELLNEPRGEYTVVIAPAPSGVARGTAPPAGELVAEFGELTDSGLGSRREVLKLLAAKYGVSTRELYSIIEKHKNSTD
jgi:16S rRNA (cytidine1402-2'-O)-methyltransferase